MSLDGEVLVQVAKVQRDKTLIEVHRILSQVPVKEQASGYRYSDRNAEAYKKDVLALIEEELR